MMGINRALSVESSGCLGAGLECISSCPSPGRESPVFHMLIVIACSVPFIFKIRSLENTCKVVKPQSGVAEGLLVSFSITVWDSLGF